MTKDEEQSVIRRVLTGDTDAFEVLVLENQKKVYNLAFRLLGNDADARDASQDAFLKAYTSLADFRGDSRFSVWLYRLTNNICIDMLRKRARTETDSLNRENEIGEETEILIPDDRFSPESALERKELREMVHAALMQLPEEFRSILIMREIGGLSYEELAAQFGLEPGTVKSRLNRARKKLCSILLRTGNFPGFDSSNGTEGV